MPDVLSAGAIRLLSVAFVALDFALVISSMPRRPGTVRIKLWQQCVASAEFLSAYHTSYADFCAASEAHVAIMLH